MFTGIIRILGAVTAVERGAVMCYALDFPHEGLEIGASVSVNGVCQTVVSLDQGVWFEAIEETLQRTTLDTLEVGQKVQIERAARFGDEIGGHLLSGHIFCTSTIEKVEGHIFTFSIDDPRYLFEKGYVAIDGMSLTVVDVLEKSFTVHLIPETLKLFTKGVGERVNLEFDALTIAAVDTVKRMSSCQ